MRNIQNVLTLQLLECLRPALAAELYSAYLATCARGALQRLISALEHAALRRLLRTRHEEERGVLPRLDSPP